MSDGPVGAESTVEVRRGGTPSDAEVAAILASLEVAWPRVGTGEVDDRRPPRWRFSGRWWSKPLPARRDRPF